MKTLSELSEESIKMLTEEFGHRCKYCYRYSEFSSTCTWDDEWTDEDDGERCIGFDWDEHALKNLQRDHLMATQFGMVDNPWKDWIRKVKI